MRPQAPAASYESRTAEALDAQDNAWGTEAIPQAGID
jgi:hypothetical protein